mgnify:CR=1 FL=1
MKALLPVYCRPLGYCIIALALFLPFLMVMMGRVTDANLLFYNCLLYTSDAADE